MSSPAILLDRDGVINVNRPDHVKSWNEFSFLPGVLNALATLSSLELPMVVVSNQAIVNRGILTAEQLDDIHRRMVAMIREAGGRIDSILYCPHDQSESCQCRKPEPGLLLEAARRFDLDLTRSVFVGDAASDIEAGKRADCRTLLVLTGRGRQAIRDVRSQRRLVPDAIAGDLSQAVPAIAQLLNIRVDPVWPYAIVPQTAATAAMD